MKITKRAVEAIALPALGQRTIEWDEQLKGFGVAVMPSGIRSYVFQYRMGGRSSVPKRITIGQHGNPWTADGARSHARDLFEQVRKGDDPKASKERIKISREMQDQRERALEFNAYTNCFFDKYILKRNIRRHEEIRRIFDRDILPQLSGKQLESVTSSELETLFEVIGQRSPSTANKAYRWLNVMYNWACKREDIAKSPLKNVDLPFEECSRDRVLDDQEVEWVWRAADQLGYPFGPIVQLLMTTGQRRDEVAGMRWTELNLVHSEWTIPGSRTKNGNTHLVPLSPLAVGMLKELSSNAATQSDYVFTTTGRTSSSGFSRAKKRLDTVVESLKGNKVPLTPWTLHDLRRSVATGCQRLGVPIDHTEALLNHTSGRSALVRTYQRYDYANEKRAVVNIWSKHLSDLLNIPEISCHNQQLDGAAQLEVPNYG